MAKNIMKNTYKNFGLSVATVFALFGMAITALAATPTLTINPNPSVTTTSASFSVFYNTNGDILTSVAVTYGTNPAMTSQTSSQTPSASSGNLSFYASGLTPGTLYYFEAIGVSSGGTVSSSRYTFTTAGISKPTIQTNPSPTYITTNGATLSGFYNDNGSSLSNLMFEYGPSSSLGYSQNVYSYGTNGTATTNISGLSAGTKYWYRLSGTNAGGTVSGSTYNFVTQGYTPINNCTINNFSPSKTSVNSGDAVFIYWYTSNCTSATLSPSGYSALSSTGYVVNPTRNTTYTLNASNGSTSDSRSFTVRVNNYNPNPNPNYNCTIDSFTSNTYNINEGSPAYLSWNTSNCSNVTLSPVGYNATNAFRYVVYPSYPSTTYKLTGSNGARLSLTIDVNNNNGGRTCTNCGQKNINQPSVTTKTVSNVNLGSAMLHGYANGNGSPVSVWFEYGTSPNLGNSTSTEYGGGATNANGYLGGLLSNQTYYYRLVARNSYGTSYGNIMSFATARNVVVNNNNSNNTVINRTNNNTNNNSDNTGNQNADSDNNSSDNQDANNNGLSASAGSAGFTLIPHTFLGWLIWILIIIIAIILVRMIMKNEYHDRGI